MTAHHRAAGLAFIAFFAGCLLLGGSSQGIWPSLILQLASILILIFALVSARSTRIHPEAKYLNILIGAALAYVALQLVPLPPALWTKLPGRELIVEGYRLTSTDLPWLPISVAPNATVASILAMLPALAAYSWLARRDDVEAHWLAFVILGVTFAAVLLGILQRSNTSFQLYPVTNGGATGFFANSNHMGALLVAAVPFLVALAKFMPPNRERRDKNAHWIWNCTAILGAGVLIIGTVVNGSLAVLLLIPSVIFASLFLLVPASKIRAGRAAVSLGVISSAMFLAAGWLVTHGLRPGDQISVSTRQDFWAHTMKLATEHGLVGAGLGSFGRLYPTTENPNNVDSVYVNLAHNDYLQTFLELGIPGLALVLCFVAWWVIAAVRIWSSESNLYGRAATIASAALLVHSIVDYPLRTAALSAVFAACLALMIKKPHHTYSEAKSRGKHLRLEDL